MNKALLEAFYKLITAEKITKFEKIAAQRTRHLTVVVENIYQDHNASAVMRSCDCFGVQDLHIIEKDNKFAINKDIALGSSKWISKFTYTDPKFPTTKCIKSLKEKGYKILATTPHTKEKSIFDIDIQQPIALVFGTEQHGLSETALSLADEYVNIPMYGFTESFNISVSAALCMQALRNRLENESELIWKLSEEEQTKLKLSWCKNILKNADKVEKELINRLKQG